MIFLCLTSFALYLYTLYPTISPYRDSGDMIVSAFTLGISHPPGYPLYVLLGKIFTILIPFGNIAYRINLMSAFFGALTCGILYLLIKKLCEGLSGNKKLLIICSSLFAVFSFCFNSSMHSLSIVSEMYSINAFFVVLIIYLLIIKQSYAMRLLAVFLLGLGLGNQQTLILLIPGIVYLIIRDIGTQGHRDIGKNRYITMLLCRYVAVFILGLSVYLFLPVRSAQGPVADWGAPSKSFRNFARVLTRADYGGIRLHPEKSPAQQNVATAVKHFIDFLKVSVGNKRGWAIAAIFFIITGMYFSIKKKLFWQLFLFWIFSGPVFFIISNLPMEDKTSLPILEPYLVMPLIIFTLWIGLGFFYVCNSLSTFIGDKIVILLIFIGIGTLIIFKMPELNKRYEFIAYDYSKDLLKTLPYNSILFNPDDTTTFTLKYQQECLGKRKDVKLAVFYKTRWGYQEIKKRYPEILPGYEIKSGKELEKTLLSYNFNRLPFYTDNISKMQGYKIFSRGLLYGNSKIFEQMFDFYVKPRISGKERFFTHQIVNYYSAGYNNLGLAFNKKKLYNKSIQFFERALAIDPALSQAYNNLGVVYWERSDYKKAADYFRKAFRYAPLDTGVKRNLEMAEEKIK